MSKEILNVKLDERESSYGNLRVQSTYTKDEAFSSKVQSHYSKELKKGA